MDNKTSEVKNEVATRHEANLSLGIFATSDNWLMTNQMAKALSSSSVVPKDFQGNIANCIVALDIANRLSVSPLMVMQNLYIIQGKPSWSSQFLIACVNASSKYDMELQYEEKTDKNGKPFSCRCWTTKEGRRVNGITIDMDMASSEGWLTKTGSKWKTMPQVMLRYRAASFFSRMNCPEMTLGFYTKEEVIDGDFKEYPIEDMKRDIENEINVQANLEEFIDDSDNGTNTDDTEPDFAK